MSIFGVTCSAGLHGKVFEDASLPLREMPSFDSKLSAAGVWEENPIFSSTVHAQVIACGGLRSRTRFHTYECIEEVFS